MIETFDIEDMLSRLKTRSENRKYGIDPVSFDEIIVFEPFNEYTGELFDREKFLSCLAEAHAVSYLDVDFPLNGNFILIKRVIRKLTHFLITRPFDSQNNFNRILCNVFDQIRNYISDAYTHSQNSFEALILDLSKNLERQSAEIYELRQQIERQSAEIYELRQKYEARNEGKYRIQAKFNRRNY